MSGLAAALLRTGAVLALVEVVGVSIVRPLFPRGAEWRWERLGWGFCAGLGGTAVMVPLALVAGIAPGWPAWIALAGVALAISVAVGAPRGAAPAEWDQERRRRPVLLFWAVILALGIAVFALRALTEPMWSNDFLAIWGLKGKTIFGSHAVPPRLFADSAFAFSHPEYPLGLPFLYAGIASLAGGWEDHAMALLFCSLQLATLAVLFGWLRRRGASSALAISAVALLSLFEPLYSAFLTGMAEIPLSCALLLLATSWSDILDAADGGSGRRLVLASLLAGGTKNEGLFLAAAAAALTFLLPARKSSAEKGKIAGASLLPAVLLAATHRLAFGPLPLRDFDFALLFGPGISQMSARVAVSLRTAFRDVARPALPGLACVAALVAAGRRSPSADRLLLLAAVALASYLLLPALAVRGPEWLVRTTLARTAAALAPLVAAGIALRLARPREGVRPEVRGER